MASTSAGTALSSAHRRSQAALTARTIRRLGATWRLLDPRKVDATAPQWLDATLPVLEVAHRESQTLATAYATRFRAVELAGQPGVGRIPVIELVPFDTASARRGLVIEGPARIKRATARGLDIQEAYRTAFAVSSAEATMKASEGAREYLTTLSERDRWARGYRRICSAKPCAFCAMLSSREYFGMPTVGFKVHPNCHCYPELIYGSPTATRQSREFAAQWSEATEGVPSRDQLNAFRRHLAAQRS